MNRVFLYVSLVALIVGLAVANLSLVWADSISLSRSSGPPDTSVTVSGTDFTAGESVSITFDGSQVATAQADAEGSWSTSFIVPKSTEGSHTIQAGTAASSFSVTPKITSQASPTSGSVGTRVRVSGEGFGTAPLTIFMGSEQVGSVSANSNGSLSASFTAPGLGAGSYLVKVGTHSAGNFRITSTFNISPTSGKAGTSVTVRGSGFGSNSQVSITFDNQEIATAAADGEGEISVTVDVPPGVAGGSHDIAASSPSGTVQATFSVTATLSLDQSEVSPGDQVTVSGTGFRASETGISIKFDGKSVKSGIAADSLGVWSESFTVPDAPAGSHRIQASGSLTALSSVPQLSVTLGAGLRLERTSGPPGTPVRVNGSGARSGERITVIIGNNLDRTEVAANRSGVWSADITIPAAPGGRLSIIASGATSRATETSFTVTPIITLAEPKGSPGSKLTLKGDGFQSNQIGIPITFADSIIGAASADQQGSWTAVLTIPPAASGTYGVRVSGAIGVQQLPFTITPGITLSKTRVGPGETVTISGSGFAANERDITVTLGETAAGSAILANTDGSWSHTYRIPQLPANSYIVSATGSVTSAASVSEGVLTLAPQVTLSATFGTPGTTVNIIGRGFGANERNIEITYDGKVVLNGIAADRSGTFTSSFDVPLSASGDHSILVGSNAVGGGASGAEIGFQIRPNINLEYADGPPGQSMTVEGTGFGANEAGISLEYDGATLVSDINADALGSFQASFLIPPSAAGSHRIQARSPFGSATARPVQDFTVSPRVDLSEDAGDVASKLGVTGQGFQPEATITLTYDDLTKATVTADDSGSFQLEFVVPESKSGQHTIKVLDDGGNQVETTFTLENIPPNAPALHSPENGDRGGLLGGFQPEAQWSEVVDPSGIRYTLQIAKDDDPEFLNPVLEKVGLESPRYALSEEEALDRGKYLWRVKAVDKASNEGPWSNSFTVQSGIIPVWVIPTLVVLGLLASGGGAYAYINNRQRRAKEEAVMPEFVRILQPEAAPALAAPTAATATTAALAAPPRRALPSPFRRSRGLSPEEQARLQMVVDFVRSIPLIGVSTNLAWLEELVEMMGRAKEEVYEQVLEGQLDLLYQPAWLQHPTYEELRVIPQAQSLLQGLETYIGAVNECATETVGLLRRLNSDISTAGQLDTINANQWRFVLAIALSTIAWFRGTYLGQTSSREYIVEPMPETESWDAADGSRVSLRGEESTPFSGLILEGLTDEDAIFYRDLHIQLRVRYRSQEEGRVLAAKLTSTDTLREQLMQGIAQMGEMAQRS